jgi:hypothetical protein
MNTFRLNLLLGLSVQVEHHDLCDEITSVGMDVLKAVTMNSTALCDGGGRFNGTYCFHLQEHLQA